MVEGTKETKKGDVRLFTVTTPPLPVDIDVSPTLMKAGNYLILTSNEQLAKDILAVKTGQNKGLAGTAEFKRMAAGMDLKGNQMYYLSGKVTKEYGAFMKTLIKFAETEAPNFPEGGLRIRDMIKTFFLPSEKVPAASQLGIMRVTAEGIVFESRQQR